MRLPPGVTRDEIVALERAHVWPPYTSSERHEGVDPLVAVAAEGIWLEDANGKKYVDASASWWTCTLGHGHPRLRAALSRQLAELEHVSAGGITHAPAALLARELTEAAPPGLTRVHFSDDGSTAVEVAVKIAVQYWRQNGRPGRHRFLALSGAYHGDTIGAASLASLEEFRGVFAPLLFDVLRPPHPDDVRGWARVVELLQSILRERSDEIAGVVVEPLVQGAAGMRMHEPAVLAAIADAAREAGTLLIADEVFTGYGRTGRMWACDHASVVPDIMCVAKGFTAGVLPMAATLATERVYDGFRGGAERALMHGHTFCGNPLGASVAREVLAIYHDEHVVSQVARKAPIVREAFDTIRKLDGVARTRSLGLIGAADLGDGGYRGALGWKVFDAALERGVFLRPLGDTVYVTPPLTITDGELRHLLAVVSDSIRAALA
ncbi:MAG: adenosylmethionine--8-amino-7-oxononanoate transaminase [Sandaracinaceae bacterium]|nr:adenosylmethionine--8-amino-7-oxononanoate transaminase [Sandaracinaceae bacterium]